MSAKFFIIGAGLWGAVMAERLASQLHLPVTIFEKRAHIGGNCHSQLDPETGIECHIYGSHIFHTSLPEVWHYITQFTEFTNYRHTVLTKHNGKIYSMPINLATINALYNRNFTPEEAKEFLQREIAEAKIAAPQNLEEQAISLIGRPLYEAFIKNYTQKQWACAPKDLPKEIITRLPFRTSYNCNYFTDTWQGVPKDGYFNLFKRLLDHPNITIELNTSYAKIKDQLPKDATVIYTGLVDELCNYQYGPLAWRSLEFSWETVNVCDYQGTAVLNYADLDVSYTRIHEFKHYHPERIEPFNLAKSVICREYPANFSPGLEAYYPVNNAQNNLLYERYAEECAKTQQIILGGRLGKYKYFDMDKTIADALNTFNALQKEIVG
ncbi:MAG: UDP-galactopyranose mutase [Desulfovibrionaceae bacterium]|nr:UDP-galactopyranose mutase [Desulfovibrionaceae bacterium]